MYIYIYKYTYVYASVPSHKRMSRVDDFISLVAYPFCKMRDC